MTTPAIKAIRITSIPHLSILCADPTSIETNERFVNQFKVDMQGMLYELYQSYLTRVKAANADQGESIELLWMTTPVQNQPYKASISLYLIIRALNPNEGIAQRNAESMLTICTGTLGRDRYSYDMCDVDEIKELWSHINRNEALAIAKQERVDILTTAPVKSCYSFDLIKETGTDLGRLVNTLIDNPHCAVSMQLIPTFFSHQEKAALLTYEQQLGMFANGTLVGSAGNVHIESARHAAQIYTYYSSRAKSDNPLFLFNIIIYAEDLQTSEIPARLMGQINAGNGASASLSAFPVRNIDPIEDFEKFPWIVNKWTMQNARTPMIWQRRMASPIMQRLPFIITSDEASEFFRLPIGNDNIGAGISVNMSGGTSKSYAKDLLNQGQLPFGKIKSSSSADEIGVNLIDLAKHMLIVGTPGSGKTNFSVGLLTKLWKEYKIPFLVIEPAKNEYRAMIESIPELQVFTPGKNFISPFVFNPFIPPEGVRIESYKSTLKTAFAAGVTMSTPLDRIFEDTINNCYSKFGWYSDIRGEIFNISDFVKCFEQTFQEIGYSGEAKNIGRGGIMRLQGLVRLFDNYSTIPIADLLKKPTIIELAAIENSDEKALYIALILLSVLAYVNANYVGNGDQLKNFILVEEAHVLLDARSHGGEGAANPAAIAQELVERMLAEIRSYGVGVAIADQAPRKVGSNIVALTDIKLGFRLVEKEDREIFGNSVSMKPAQIERLAKLKPGEAFMFFIKMEEPEEIITPEHRTSKGLKISLSDNELAARPGYWSLHPEMLRPYPECEKFKQCPKTCDYNCRMLSREIGVRLAKKIIAKEATYKEAFSQMKQKLMGMIDNEVATELNTPKLRACIFIHAFRYLKLKK